MATGADGQPDGRSCVGSITEIEPAYPGESKVPPAK